MNKPNSKHKKANKMARAGCPMCRPWKKGRTRRGGGAFEKFSDYVRRTTPINEE